MNPYKMQSIQFAFELETKGSSRKEIKDWIYKIITKSETSEPWMERVRCACDLPDAELLNALNAIPYGHSQDALWEKMLRRPIISRNNLP